MKEFDQLCKAFEEMDLLSYGTLLQEKSNTVVPALAAVSGSDYTGLSAFATFIMGAIAVDGRLTEEEYILTKPMFEAFFGNTVDFELCSGLIRRMKPENKELKKNTDHLVDALGHLSEELKEDIITVCMLICAVDGKISLKEKNWIKQLIRD